MATFQTRLRGVTKGMKSKRIDLRSHVLDRQILDNEGKPVGAVDDVEISVDPRPRVTALMTGRALMNRLAGGVPQVNLLDRLDIDDVDDIGTVVTLKRDCGDLPLTWTERWVRDHLISKIPGADQ